MTTTTVMGRLIALVGACSIAAFLFVVVLVIAGEIRDWLIAMRKRRRRVQQVVSLASGQRARVIQPTPPPAAALMHRAHQQREIELLEREWNMKPFLGVED